MSNEINERRSLPFIWDDGGRQAAGYRGQTGDCVTRAIAIATKQPYETVYKALNGIAKDERPKKRRGNKRSSSRSGVFKSTYETYLDWLGWEWTPTMGIGTGCKVHLAEGELPMGRLIVSVSKHLVAVIDGEVFDASNPCRSGNRCVYGYYERTS